MTRTVTLLTDFGTRDGYVGAMKGVVLSRCSEARVVDLTHDVPPQDIAAGAWALRNAWRWFPEGTIHVIVVDPGVGSGRRSVLVESSGQLFVGPDNGVIPLALGDSPVDRAFEITNPDAMAPVRSDTFHGRDVFSWCAGWIAAGNDPAEAGPEIPRERLVALDAPVPAVARQGARVTISGGVLTADRFGNLITTIPNALVETSIGGQWEVTVDGQEVPFGRTFSDVPPGQPVCYAGSSDAIEVAVSMGSALERFGTGVRVELRGSRADDG